MPHPCRQWMVRAALVLLLVAAQTPLQAADAPGPQVAWLNAASDTDIERAFTQARGEGKPLLLYWGAKWCPPCNQLKATLFNRQDFIERTKNLVAVNIDGDLPGAQKLGARFKVRGYPTMVLLRADGVEITRLPGEVDAAQALSVLQLGLSGGRPAAAVLADARAGKPLSGPEWRLLAWYAWDVDQDQLVPENERAALLAQLAARAPAAEADAATRLLLKALAESDDGKGLKPDAATRARVRALLADPAAARRQMDVLVNFAREITQALSPSPGRDRQALVVAFEQALKRLQDDAGLSRGDRVSALASRVELARLGQAKEERHPKLPAPLRAEAKALAAQMDRDIGDAHERQAVVTSAAYVLGRAGLWADADALLKANLERSHSPYYLMSALAGNARKLGRHDEALRWLGEAYASSVGPATRLQWGAAYVAGLVELAPKDGARIERAAAEVLGDAAHDTAAFHERSARSLQRMAGKLAEWNASGEREAVIGRLQQRLEPVCAALPVADAQRKACDGLLKSAAKGRGA